MTQREEKEIRVRIGRMRENGMTENADRLERALDDELRAENPAAVAKAVRAYSILSGLERAQFLSENSKVLSAAAFKFRDHALVKAALEE